MQDRLWQYAWKADTATPTVEDVLNANSDKTTLSEGQQQQELTLAIEEVASYILTSATRGTIRVTDERLKTKII